MYDVVFGYVVGTIVGIVLFRWYVKERVVSATLDMLIEGQYVRSYIDRDGVTQLYRWDEDNEPPISWEVLEKLIDDMENNPDKYEEMIDEILNSGDSEEENNEEDDTP